MLPSACGLGQHFQDLGHSFSLYGPPSRPITYVYIRQKSLPPELFMEILSRDLGLDIDVLMMAKFKKISKSVFEKIKSEFSRRQNITNIKLF